MSIWDNRNFEPMLLDEQKEAFDSKDYIFEIKYDGIRALIFATPEKLNIQSRKKQDITHLYPEFQTIKKIVKEPTIFDGEIICIKNGKPSFTKLQERSHLKSLSKIKYSQKTNPALFICFDILYKNKELINLSLIERKKILNKYEENENFHKVMYIKLLGKKLYKNTKRLNLEGVIAKKSNSVYEINTRSKNWIKIKNFKYGEFLIGGYYEKSKNYVFTVSLGEVVKNKLMHVGNVSIAKKDLLYNKIKKLKVVNNSPFENYNDKKIKYVSKYFKVKIEYLERTSSNNLRQPVFIKEII